MRFLLGILLCVFVLLLQLELVYATEDFTYLITGSHPIPDGYNYSKAMVSIRSRVARKYFGDNHFCAGIIISEDAVLTTAHCVMDKRKVVTRARRLAIVAGTPNRLERTHTTVQYAVKSVTANVDFIMFNIRDVAIIRIKGTFDFTNENIDYLSLPELPASYDIDCEIVGWGRLYFHGPLAAEAMVSRVHVLKPEECLAITHNEIPGTLCAGAHGYNDPCRGDSGGPMICNKILTGIIAYPIGCGQFNYPSIYVDVYYNLDWINKIMHEGQASLRVSVALLAILLLFSQLYLFLFPNL